ncbi:hypothetical protein cypCar_00007522 [Cyprinus carpio]|nr:hypothetical protein cypCar_00007522 [Cyprinus carpio]
MKNLGLKTAELVREAEKVMARLENVKNNTRDSDFGDFSLAKTISIIEDRVSDDLTEELLQDDIMPSAGEEMGAEAQIRFLKAKLRVMRVELNRLEYECNKYECNKKDDENSTLSSKPKDIEEERARHQRTTNVQQTQVVKQSALAEESSRTCEGLQQQVEAQKELESMKRTHKQAASTQSATEVRLNRALH